MGNWRECAFSKFQNFNFFSQFIFSIFVPRKFQSTQNDVPNEHWHYLFYPPSCHTLPMHFGPEANKFCPDGSEKSRLHNGCLRQLPGICQWHCAGRGILHNLEIFNYEKLVEKLL
jgi:hypothetical protein